MKKSDTVNQEQIKCRIADLRSKLAALSDSHAKLVKQFQEQGLKNQQEANRIEGAISALRELLTSKTTE